MKRHSEAYDLRAHFTFRLLVLSNTLGKGAERLYGGRFGLRLPEWRTIAVLAMLGRASVNALAAALVTDKGWVSRIVAILSQRGLIAARGDPADARKVELELSRKGRALYGRIVPAAAARQARLLQALSASERAALDRILHKLQGRAAEMLADTERALAGRGSTRRRNRKLPLRPRALRAPMTKDHTWHSSPSSLR